MADDGRYMTPAGWDDVPEPATLPDFVTPPLPESGSVPPCKCADVDKQLASLTNHVLGMLATLDSVGEHVDIMRVQSRTNGATLAALVNESTRLGERVWELREQAGSVAESQRWMADTVHKTVTELPKMIPGFGGFFGRRKHKEDTDDTDDTPSEANDGG